MKECNRGSEWRQWDLHLHTKSSYDYAYKGEDADQILCNTLKKEKISAVAITDHFIIDRKRIENLRKIAPEIVFFPAVELRTDKGGSNIHVILIFSDKINLPELEADFNSGMVRSHRSGNRNENYYWEFNDILMFAKQHNAIITIHAGNKKNGIDEQITNSLPVSEAIKEDIASKIDIFEMGKIENLEDYKTHVFPSIGEKAMIMCSDNHDPRSYTRKEKLWIKADISFKGLEYAIKDPSNRIFVGNIPPKNQIVLDNQTKYIDTVKIKKVGTKTNEIWFENNELELNQDLIAIIGNKGNGKSALADIIAFNSNHKENFSFLTDKRFKAPKSKLAENFESEVTWKNGTRVVRNLNEEINSKIPTVKYIPQSYLEKVCNEIVDGKKSEFNIELEKVIFSHIPEAERLGYDSFEKLIETTTNTRKIEKNKIIEEVKIINKNIAELYKKIYSENKLVLQEKLAQKKLELEALTKQQPKEVLKPENSEEIKEEQEKLLLQITNLEANKKKLIIESDELTRKYAKTKIDIQYLHEILERTNSIKGDIENYKNKIDKILKTNDLKINVDDILKFEINLESVNLELRKVSKEQGEISEKLSKDKKDSITQKIESINLEIMKVTEKLNEPNKIYQKYEKELKEWNDKISKINGDSNKIDTILYYEEELRKINEEYPKEIEQLEAERNSKTELIFSEIIKEVDILKKYYLPVQEFIDNNSEIINNMKLKFDVIIVENGFKEKFINYINLSKKGTYNRNETKVNEILSEASFENFEGIEKFLKQIIGSLKKNISLQIPDEMEIISQLKDIEKLNDLFDFIYSLDYLAVQYELKLGEKNLNELSPGERGLLLLIFYLLIDKDTCPLIIDQPEENLDNDTITQVLVPCINAARTRRQIIMVTHNPNLAVVCDAEQIIYCEIDKKNKNKVTYESGSLENEKLNKRVTDILEGTMKAFRIRDKRYIE